MVTWRFRIQKIAKALRKLNHQFCVLVDCSALHCKQPVASALVSMLIEHLKSNLVAEVLEQQRFVPVGLVCQVDR